MAYPDALKIYFSRSIFFKSRIIIFSPLTNSPFREPLYVNLFVKSQRNHEPE